jgi:hypothetical protein
MITRSRAVMLVVAAVIAGTVVAGALSASGNGTSKHRTTWKSGLAVFSHPKSRARIAQADSASPPSGAVLAAVVGQTEVYVSQSGSELCVMHMTGSSGGGSVCGQVPAVEAEGVVGVGTGVEKSNVRVTALLPNGVKAVTFTDRDGSSYDVAVTNNVVSREDNNLTSVSYSTANGASHTTNVAAMLAHIPSQPGPASSSN